jgi:membrane-bound lytic murein transglycosylase D
MEKRLPMTNKTLGLVAAMAALLSGCAATTNTPEGISVGNSTRGILASGDADVPPLVNLQASADPSASGTPLGGLTSSDHGPVNVTPVDPLDSDRPVDTKAAAAQEDLWQRIRDGFAIPDLDSDLVHNREQFYLSKPDYIQRMTERSSRYLYHVVSEIEKRHMPTELALLPFVESAFNPHALSSAQASGMWQFVPATGKDYDLKQNLFQDDRRDVMASTKAALDHLQHLYSMFGDWHLALAAYNWGEGSVQRAIARNQKAGLPTDYQSLRMPEETRYYVPKLQAIKNIIAHPDQFAVSLPPLENHPYFLSVPLDRDIDVDLAAKLAGITVSEFRQLNPQMNKPVILAAGIEQLLLPYDAADRFVDNLRNYHGQLASWTAWVAPKTMRPGDVAKQVGMAEGELRDINHIPARMLVKAGSTLLVPRSAARTSDVSEAVAESATMRLAPDVPPLRRVALKAGRKGESIAAVAQRYRVSIAQVAQWNKVSTKARFRPGANIVVFVSAHESRLALADEQVNDQPRNRGAASPTRHSKAKPAATKRVNTKTTKVARAKSTASSRGKMLKAASTTKSTKVAQR